MAEACAFGVDQIEIAAPVTLSGLWEDLLTHTPPRRRRGGVSYGLLLLATGLVSSGFHCVALYRLGAFFRKHGVLPLAIVAEKIIFHWYGCLFPSSAKIGPGLWVPHPMGIVLNKNARLGRNVWLRQNVQILQATDGASGLVGDDTHLCASSTIIKGGAVSHRCVVGAHALVTKVVPPDSVAFGMPATFKPIRDDQRVPEISRSVVREAAGLSDHRGYEGRYDVALS